MRALASSLLLCLIPMMTFGEVPESILGTWQIDLVRTVHEQIDQLAQARPDEISADAAQMQKAAVTAAYQSSEPQMTVTFTETTLTSNTNAEDPTTNPYTVIGGNSRLLIVEFTDEYGFESVGKIRFVEGGIAMQTINCQEQPEWCEHDRRRAVQRATQKFAKSKATSTTSMTSQAPTVGGLAPVMPRNDPLQPKWVYFKQVVSE